MSHLIRSASRPREIHFLYATKSNSDIDPQRILFCGRLLDLIAAAGDQNVTLSLFLTGTGDEGPIEHGTRPNSTFARRLSEADLVSAIDGYRKGIYGPEHDREGTVAMVCGPPTMTDSLVGMLRGQTGMAENRVLCEKWW